MVGLLLLLLVLVLLLLLLSSSGAPPTRLTLRWSPSPLHCMVSPWVLPTLLLLLLLLRASLLMA